MANLTAIVPVFNEEKNVEQVLKTVLFADEIIVLDSYSTDKTIEIAQKYPVQILQREYENSASQKNWAIPQAKHNWILLVDADERVSEALQNEIKNILSSKNPEVAYWMYRENYFMGKKMNHGGLNTDKVTRLFRKDVCLYQEKNVHAEIIPQGKVGFLKEKLWHNTYTTFDQYIAKKNRYAWWSAKDHYQKNISIGFFRMFLKPTYRFFKHYFLQLGFLDGIPGFSYAFIESYGVLTRNLKIWLMQKGQFENQPDKKPKFLLYISYSYGIPILKPVEKALKEQGFEVAWFLEISSVKTHFQAGENLLFSTADVLNFEPSVILAATNEVPHFFPGIKVQVFHGFSVSKRSEQKGHFRIRGLFDLYCTQGPSTTETFKKLEQKMGHFKVTETGWPKMDWLFPVEKTANPKPVILLASTFTESLSLAHFNGVFEEITRLVETQKYDWIFTLHPKMDESIVLKFKALAEKYQYPFISDPQNLDHLKKADILVTDTSSIITEFILQGKPVVTFRNRKPGAHLLNTERIDEIEKNIDVALSRPKELMENIQKFNAKEHPYNDGKSSERVVQEALHMYYNLENMKLKRKPLNIVRKIQLRKKTN